MKNVWLIGLVFVLASCGGGKIEGEKTFNYQGSQHQQGRIDYTETPPVGGLHNPVWQNCGVYDQPIANEYAVHSLEHGAVWITYRPDLPSAEVDKLKALVDGRGHTLLSPYPNLPSPVVVSAWNRQLSVENADDKRLERFLEAYESGSQAPERGASCSGGMGDTL
ncbi:DUF3105 domain-containing protein [Deinococcus peraridilitoris]|uniref:DUF3105 domain-containing protein n=1 Tax=Deinococcus peraridilitoris (strain DSM 19664 / LMG 22246 / CIP 109416 / KR-200) TaxID=937777 RepID=L0A115_DEIPD|nr:DUF3105 domain-containing protein [Deinococcus peraridilitoris]AFZ66695.1 Protein of unknown function (DUF3105) [Deinococcus peraridilitoris DSM 19664]